MGVYIRGMEMPKSCAECPVNMNICKRGYKYLLAHMELYDQRADDCPITTVPPHGRLIDADALKDIEFHGMQADKKISYQMGWNDAIATIAENATIIIPTEEAHDEIY